MTTEPHSLQRVWAEQATVRRVLPGQVAGMPSTEHCGHLSTAGYQKACDTTPAPPHLPVPPQYPSWGTERLL